jgi:hypothetical protein
MFNVPAVQEEHVVHRRCPERSWWRGLYTRVPGSNTVPPHAPATWPLDLDNEKRKNLSLVHELSQCLVDSDGDVAARIYDDPPPPSRIRRYKENKLYQYSTQAPQLPFASSFTHTASAPVACASTQLVEETSHADDINPSDAKASHSAPSLTAIPSPSDNSSARAAHPHIAATYSTETLADADALFQPLRRQPQLTHISSVVPSVARKAVSRKPVRYLLSTNPTVGALNAYVEKGIVPPTPGHVLSKHCGTDNTTALSHPADSVGRVTGSTTTELSDTPIPYVSTGCVPQQDQIVVPTLLAPVDSPSFPTPPPLLISHAHEEYMGGPFRTYMIPSKTNLCTDSSLANDPKQLHRSRSPSIRRKSHSFMQQLFFPDSSRRSIQNI